MLKDVEPEVVIFNGISFKNEGNIEVLKEVSTMYTDAILEHCQALQGV